MSIYKKSKRTKLSPPWITYYKKIDALFSADPDVEVSYSDDDVAVTLSVKGPAKAEAIKRLVPPEVNFGNVSLTISVVTADGGRSSVADDFRTAFKGNPNVADIETVSGEGVPPLTYVIFRREVVQFYNDDLTDIHGNCTTLNEFIAKEIFGDPSGVYFCTDNLKPIIPRQVTERPVTEQKH